MNFPTSPQSSTAALVIDDRTTAERWSQHARVVMANASTYVIAIGGTLISILQDQWKVMSADQQTGILASFGVTNPGTLTALLTIVTLIVRLVPAARGQVTPATRDALERAAAEQTNARLIAQGQQPLALPAPKLLVITHGQLAAARAQSGAPAVAAPAPTVPTVDDIYNDEADPAPVPAAPAVPVPTARPPADFADTAQMVPPREPPTPAVVTLAQLQAIRDPDDILAAVSRLRPGLTEADMAQVFRQALARIEASASPLN